MVATYIAELEREVLIQKRRVNLAAAGLIGPNNEVS
jgi:hypothetical protein